MRGRDGPFDPEELTKEYAALCKDYRVTGVTGDKYAREWVRRLAQVLDPYTAATLTASELYCEVLPLWTRAAVRIPDHPVLVRELRLLERTPTRMGKDQVVHPRGVHDDYANVCFGALHGLRKNVYASMDWVDANESADARERWARQQLQQSVYGNSLGIPFGGRF